jgi:O-methyltransferase involved in polyketide biosynthesis
MQSGTAGAFRTKDRNVMTKPDWASTKVDVDRPSSARIYDYFLGGAHNFEVDRQAAEAMAKVHPAIGLGMRANRSYLRRAVRYLCDLGIDQFLDLGSGIPTVGNVHEIAQRANPAARVVYVDIEPIAVSHSNSILAGNERASAILGDLRQPEAILAAPEIEELLDLSRPVAIVLAGVLQYVSDADNPAAIIGRYRDALPSGSYFALSHPSQDKLTLERAAGATASAKVYNRTETPFTYRALAEFETFFAGLDVVEPGVVEMWEWRPEPGKEPDELEGRVSGFAGVGRVPNARSYPPVAVL